ncbi:hypothetical protein BD414DRAFT_489909 [Trametes punicea]|nr:hypothetical protein BD414DRAFT_489909 [Trametes punicea]
MTRVSPRTLSLWLVLLGPELAQRAACGLAPPNWPQECTDPTYSWLRNSAGQSACGVLSQLSIPCLSSIVTYKPLPATSCLCNTVIYSFVYACGLCTGQSRLETT